ncbi:MAG: hypothetical protein ACE5JL_10450, partial [Dehalococcoidia bacterium]
MAGSLRSHFLSEEFYTSHFAENDAYNRLYETVLIPRIEEELEEEGRADFIGGLRIDQEDVAGLVMEILPLSYLQEQVESTIDGAVSYLDKDEDPTTGMPFDVPDVYVELRPIIGTRVPTPTGIFPVQGRAKPAIFQFLGEQLENNIEFLPPPGGTLSQRLE